MSDLVSKGKCPRCGKWAGAHATLPGQPRDHLCICQTDRIETLEFELGGALDSLKAAEEHIAKLERENADLLAALKELAASVNGITVGETCEEEQRVSKAWQAAHAAIARHEHA